MRYKAIFKPGQDLRQVREAISRHGIQYPYFAQKEDALFFEADEARVIEAVGKIEGVHRVISVGE